MRKYILSIIILFSFTFSINTYSQSSKKQNFTTKSRKAKKAFERAISYFNVQNYSEAMIDVNTALKYDSNFVEAYLMAGQIFAETKKSNKSLYYYRKASIVNPDFYPDVFITMAIMEMDLGMYKNALSDFTTYDNHPRKNRHYQPTINQGLDRAAFGIWNMEHPVEFDPKNLGSAVNSHNDEYVNTVNTEENKVIFTRKPPQKPHSRDQRGRKDEDFYVSLRPSADQQWRMAKALGFIFNTSGNEGAMNISPDQSRMVFTACYRNDGMGRCDIYLSYKKGKTWSMPVNIGPPVNTGDWESNPSLSSDGKTLYFVRRKGQGNSDIYTAELQKDGTYANVKLISDVINTEGSEMTPFIHADGRTLYFASNGHIGMGGMDLFMSRMDENGKWGEVVNLGYPINDFENQMGIIVNSQGHTAYISSDKGDGFGGYDIYSFDLYENARPIQTNYMKGVVADSRTKKALEADFELYDLNTKKLIVESKSDAKDGSFLVVIPDNAELGLTVSKKGYLIFSENFKVGDGYSSSKPFFKDVLLQRITVNQKVVLNNIFFASLSYKLEDKSFVELDKVKEFLLKNPNVEIEIGGHTDNIGSYKDNLSLSKKRAKAVYDYLLNTLKINPENLSYKGYADSMPLVTNDTEEGRAKNRRTELKVIKIKK